MLSNYNSGNNYAGMFRKNNSLQKRIDAGGPPSVIEEEVYINTLNSIRE